MPASHHLSRVVFRRIAAHPPPLCPACRSSLLPLRTLVPRRSFFGLFKPERKVKPAVVPPGLPALTHLGAAQIDNLQLPPPSDIAAALAAFFAQDSAPLKLFHVQHALNAYRYLLKNPKQDATPWLSQEQLDNMMRRLVQAAPLEPEVPLAFGRMLHAEAKRLHEWEWQGRHDGAPAALRDWQTRRLWRFLELLTAFGASLEARDMVSASFPWPKSPAPDEQKLVLKSWHLVLKGLAREDNEADLLRTVQIMADRGIPWTLSLQVTLVSYFLDKKDLTQAKKWYAKPTTSLEGYEPEVSRHQESILPRLLQACALSGDHAFGHQVVASLLTKMPDKPVWDAMFLWSAAIGKGPDEIDRMMNVMVRRSGEQHSKDPSAPLLYPDIATINLLVEHAMSQQDSYSAERYVSLGEKRGISPDERTYTLQIQYRLSIRDIDGARAAYFGLQGQLSGDEQTLLVINRLIQALCASQQPHYFDDIMTMVDDLHERKARLAPETVSALCILHLRRGEAHDAIDLLQVHAFHFGPEQRAIIRKDLAAFILDGQTATADAWDAYQILREVFSETPREDRVPIMNNFFARKRSDMACHVFFHMRNHTHETITTNKAVYLAAFVGFARNADAESLELVHNQLRLDLNVDLDTELRNALMLAYASTGNNRKALEIWAEIGSSKEGPTYNSIAIAFRSCEGTHYGDRHAKSIWRRLKELDIDIDKKIWTAYLGAIARNHLHDEALALVESVEREYGFTPDISMYDFQSLDGFSC